MTARVDCWRVSVLLFSLVLNVYHLNWGLPHGNTSWAADSIGPVTVLGIVQRSVGEWNSGWFWFKYPLGYPFLLAAAFTPYLGYLYVTGGWQDPIATYPYGFADPEHTLLILSLIGRALSVAFAVGTVALTYAIGRRLFGRWTGWLAAVLVATAYPVIYYAHTTNLDGGYLFWLILALYCAIIASETKRAVPWLGLGVAAAMAVSSKEQGFAFLVPLPVLVFAAHIKSSRSARICWSRPAMLMAVAAVGTVVLANNVLFNPLGFVSRVAYLLGHPLGPVAARLAPVEFALWKGAKEWTYVQQMWDGMESALGIPVATLAVVGAVTAWRVPRMARWLLVPMLTHYYISLRGMDLITLRYLLPFFVIGTLLAAGVITQLYASVPRAAARGAVLLTAVAVAGLGIGRAIEFHWLLRTDSRYQAEAWMHTHLPGGTRVETYQKPVYLPRVREPFVVDRVPIEERSITGVAERRPDAIILSSASEKSIAHIWNPDWRVTRTLLLPRQEAVTFLDALERGALPYRAVARFRQRPYLLRPRITSLAPEITIYVRDKQ